MKLPTAKKYAAQIVAWLDPYCERIEVAGSIRRQRAVCNDVDIVCIPRVVIERDIFGSISSSRNLLWEFMVAYAAQPANGATILTGGLRPGKMMIVKLKKCQLDLWFADERNFITRLVCRTGSKEHNIWLVQRSLALGMQWNPSEGIAKNGVLFPTRDEVIFYVALGLPFIAPENREAHWLATNL